MQNLIRWIFKIFPTRTKWTKICCYILKINIYICRFDYQFWMIKQCSKQWATIWSSLLWLFHEQVCVGTYDGISIKAILLLKVVFQLSFLKTLTFIKNSWVLKNLKFFLFSLYKKRRWCLGWSKSTPLVKYLYHQIIIELIIINHYLQNLNFYFK